MVELNVKFPPLAGVPFGDQFVVVFQVELVVPVHVRFCARAGTPHAAESNKLRAAMRAEDGNNKTRCDKKRKQQEEVA